MSHDTSFDIVLVYIYGFTIEALSLNSVTNNTEIVLFAVVILIFYVYYDVKYLQSV